MIVGTKIKDVPQLIGNLEIEPIISEITQGLWIVFIVVAIIGSLILLSPWFFVKLKVLLKK